jgi:hypothetical protein
MDPKKAFLEELRGHVSDFVLTVVFVVKGVLISLILAFAVSKMPWLSEQLGISTNNPIVGLILTAGDIGSAAIGLISTWKDLNKLYSQ